MTPPRVLFWHRRDLRLADNLGLVAAVGMSPAVTGVYVLDPKVIKPPPELPPMAPARLWFLIESLIELQQRWRDAGSRMLVLDGDPVTVLPKLAEQIGAEAVVWNRDVEPYARERDRQVAKRLQADGRTVVVDWDQLLIAPELLKTGGGRSLSGLRPLPAQLAWSGPGQPTRDRVGSIRFGGSGTGVGAGFHLACCASSEPWFCWQ